MTTAKVQEHNRVSVPNTFNFLKSYVTFPPGTEQNETTVYKRHEFNLFDLQGQTEVKCFFSFIFIVCLNPSSVM